MWEKQWARVGRRYKRLEAMNTPKEHIGPTQDYDDDDFHAFFTDCYHLKDWLKNDSTSGVSGREVEDFVAKSSNLKLCGDLANGSKHLLLTNPKIDPKARIGGKLFKVGLQAGGSLREPTTIAHSYKVEALGKALDGFDLATNCVSEWEAFLKSKSLPIT